jgi:hypothetical protein
VGVGVAVTTMIVIAITIIILWKLAIRRSMYPMSVYLFIEIRDILYCIGIFVTNLLHGAESFLRS